MPKFLNKSIQLLFFLSLFLLSITSCENRPKSVVSEKKMINILSEMHTLEATLIEKGWMYNDSIKTRCFNSLLSKHGLSQAEFDSSLVWYTKNPKKFQIIYEKVIVNLSNQQKLIKTGFYHPAEFAELSHVKINLWNKKNSYSFTKDSTRTRLNFEIKNFSFMYQDVYILKFLQRISPCDSSYKPYVLLRINYQNGEYEIAGAPSHSDSIQRRFTLRLPATKKLKIKSITGCLLGSRVFKGRFSASADSISFVRRYNPLIQDSLSRIVDKNDTTNYNRVQGIKKQAEQLRKPLKINT